MRLASAEPVQPIGLPGRRSVRLALALLAALCLHAGAALLRWDASARAQSNVSHAIAVRLIPAAADAGVVDSDPDAIGPSAAASPDLAHSDNEKAATPIDSPSSSRPFASVQRSDRASAAAAPSSSPVSPVPAPAFRTAMAASVPAADTALAPAPDYFFGGRLDPGPRPLGDIDPEYPDSANLQEGTVVLRLLISEAGVVDNVAVVSADPKGLFESAALDAFGKAKFSPGMILGTPVKSQITVEVHFQPINRGARISGRTY